MISLHEKEKKSSVLKKQLTAKELLSTIGYVEISNIMRSD